MVPDILVYHQAGKPYWKRNAQYGWPPSINNFVPAPYYNEILSTFLQNELPYSGGHMYRALPFVSAPCIKAYI